MRSLFLSLLLLFSGASDAQVAKILHGFVGVSSNQDFTTPDNKQIWWSIGHSIAAGYTNNDGSKGDAPVAGTVFEWTGTAEVQVTTNDISTANSCSMWPSFGKTMYNLSGIRPVIIATGVPNSKFYDSSTPGLSWFTNGTLYTLASNKMNSGLSYYHLKRPAGILIELGINDITSSETIGTVLTSITSLIDRIRADYPGIKIYINIPGPNGLTTSTRYSAVSWAIKDLETTYASDVYVVINGHYIIFTAGNVDGLHPNKAGYDAMGRILANYVYNADNDSDKDIRRVINNFETKPNSTQCAAIRTFITDDKADGTWAGRDGFQCYVSTVSKANAMQDWIGVTAPRDPTSITWTSGSTGVTANGSSTYLDPFVRPGHLARNLVLNDAYMVCVNGTNSTAAGTLATLFGSNSPFLRLYQSASSDVRYGLNTATDKTYTGVTAIQSGKHHMIKRTASNAIAYVVDGTTVDSGTTASTSITILGTYLGARNQNNTSVFEYMNVEIKLFTWGSASTYNSNARARENTLITAMGTP